MIINFKILMLNALLAGGLLCGCGDSESSQQDNEKPKADVNKEAPAAAADPKPVVSEGKKIYDQYCMVCHQADGKGVPNAFPPLTRTEWVLGDKNKIIEIVLNGLTGPIEVNGETYNSAMTAHDFLSDQQVADVITYVRGNFGNDADPVTASDVAAVRAGG